jgi:hypothetical protein
MKKVTFGYAITHHFTQSIKDVECRLPYWEPVARDNEIFKNKILEYEIMLSPIILNHIEKIEKKNKKIRLRRVFRPTGDPYT